MYRSFFQYFKVVMILGLMTGAVGVAQAQIVVNDDSTALESKPLPSESGAIDATSLPAPLWRPTNTNLFDAQNGPMANFGTIVVSIYKSYATGTAAAQLASQFPTVLFNDGLVGMDIKSLGGDFRQFVTQLKSLGVRVMTSSAGYGIVEGWVPVAELPTIARLPQTMAGSPIEVPIRSSLNQK